MGIQKFGNVNLEVIGTFESINGFKLPDDYIDFLLKYNGGIVETTDKNLTYVKGLGEEVSIDVLFGINTKEPELSVELWLNDYKNNMPKGAIIVGDTYQHGFIVLLCSGKDTGVYYWDHAYEFHCSNDESNTYYIADTFTDFVKNLL